MQIDSWRDRGLVHGFGCADLDVSACKSGEVELSAGVPLLLLQQVHGTKVVEADRAMESPKGEPIEADGWLSRFSGFGESRGLGIKTADCGPVLLWEPEAKLTAALHCGWRSTVGGIVFEAISQLVNMGAAVERLEAAIGPAARSCCYEVGEDVAQIIERAAKDTGIASPGEACLEGRDGRIYADVPDLLQLQLKSAGLRQNRIFRIDRCTICDKTFFSFRRQKDLSGRQVSFVIAR